MFTLPRFLRHALSVAALALLTTAAPLMGYGLKMYLTVDGIDGESTDEHFKKSIEILAFSWGVSNVGASPTTGTTASRPDLQDLAVTKFFDSSSPRLFQRVATGRIIPKVKLTIVQLVDNTARPIMVVDLEDAVVSSLSLGGSGGEHTPTENVTLAFRAVKITHVDDSNQSTSESYDSVAIGKKK